MDIKIGQEAFIGYKVTENGYSIQVGTWNGKNFMCGYKGCDSNKELLKDVLCFSTFGKFGAFDGRAFVLENGEFKQTVFPPI